MSNPSRQATGHDNLFFDLDGTLTDPREGIVKCVRHAAARLGYEVPESEDLLWFIGPPLRKSFPTLLRTEDKQVIERAVSLYRERFAEVGYLENELYPGVPQMLLLLSSKHKLFLVTSKAQVFAEQILEHFGLSRFFTRTYGPQLDGRHDEKSELIRFLLEQESLTPETCLMIGDRKEDVEAGRKNGIATLGVLYGYGSRNELELAGANRLVQSVEEIPSAVDKGE